MTTFPRFISRDDLPVSLRDAYDKAAKGTKDDKTRICGVNDKNNDKDIDSWGEVLIFQKELDKQKEKFNKYTYNDIDKCIESYKKEYDFFVNNLNAKHYQKMRELGLLPTKKEMADHSNAIAYYNLKEKHPLLHEIFCKAVILLSGPGIVETVPYYFKIDNF